MGSSPWYQNVKFDVCPSGWLEVEVNPCPTCRHLDSDIGIDLTVFDDADFIYASRQRAGGVTAIGVGLGRNRRTRFVLSLDANLSTLEGPAIDPANLSLNPGSLCRSAWSESECGCNEKATNNSSA